MLRWWWLWLKIGARALIRAGSIARWVTWRVAHNPGKRVCSFRFAQMRKAAPGGEICFREWVDPGKELVVAAMTLGSRKPKGRPSSIPDSWAMMDRGAPPRRHLFAPLWRILVCGATLQLSSVWNIRATSSIQASCMVSPTVSVENYRLLEISFFFFPHKVAVSATVYQSILASYNCSFQNLYVRWNWIYPDLRHWSHMAQLAQRRANWLFKQIGRWTNGFLHLELICSRLSKGNTFSKKKNWKIRHQICTPSRTITSPITPPLSDEHTLQTQAGWQANIPETHRGDDAVPDGGSDCENIPVTFSLPEIKIQLLPWEKCCFFKLLPKPQHILHFRVRGVFENRPGAPPRLCQSRLDHIKSTFLKHCLHYQTRTSCPSSLFTSNYWHDQYKVPSEVINGL